MGKAFNRHVYFFQHTTGQLRNRKSSAAGGTKSSKLSDIITFSDVAGVDEAKEELEEIVVWLILLLRQISVFLCFFYFNISLVRNRAGEAFVYLVLSNAQEFLRNPDRYLRLGARPPRGVLLVRFPLRRLFFSRLDRRQRADVFTA